MKTLQELHDEYQLEEDETFFDYLYETYYIGSFSSFVRIYKKELSPIQQKEFIDYLGESFENKTIDERDLLSITKDIMQLSCD